MKKKPQPFGKAFLLAAMAFHAETAKYGRNSLTKLGKVAAKVYPDDKELQAALRKARAAFGVPGDA